MSEKVGTALIPTANFELMQKILDYLDSVNVAKIKTEESYDNATRIIKELSVSVKILDNDKKALTAPYKYKAKIIDNKYKEVLDVIKGVSKKIKDAMGNYYDKQEAKRIEKQRKIEAEIEAKRRAAEVQAQKEQETADKYRTEGNEELADKAEARAKTKIDQAINTVAPIVEKKKNAGISYRTDYSILVTDNETAIKALMKSPLTSHIVTIDIAALKAMIKVAQGNFNLPGVDIGTIRTPIVRA